MTSSSFDSNVAKAEQYLERFRASGVLNFIDGAPRAGAIGENLRDALADRRQAARVRCRRRCRRCRRRGRGGAACVRRVARSAGRRPAQSLARHRRRDRGASRRDRVARVARHGPTDPLHVAGGEARCGELPLLRRQGAGSRSRLVAAGARARQLHAAPAARPRRSNHAVEHAVHVVDVEDRACAGGRLHRRAQAGRVEPDHGHAARRDRDGRGLAGRRAEYRAWARRDGGQGRDRASADPCRRVRRRVGDGQRDHGAERADAEAPALRARRQEPGHRVRRRRSRSRARRRRVHDLQLERRALHVVEPAARAEVDRGRVHGAARRARPQDQGRSSARSRHGARAADPSASTSKRCSATSMSRAARASRYR